MDILERLLVTPVKTLVITPVTPHSVQDDVTTRIRDMIRTGQLTPGEWLRQDTLATALGVSTMPVREALRRLEAEQLVIFHPRRGAMVAHISLAEFEEIHRIREEVEVLACRWVAEDFGRLNLDRLRQTLDRLIEAEGQDDIQQRPGLVREFFFTIFEASHKEHLLRIITNLWNLSEQYRHYFSAMSETIPSRLEYYRRIYQACETADADTLVGAVRELYAYVAETLIPRLRELGG